MIAKGFWWAILAYVIVYALVYFVANILRKINKLFGGIVSNIHVLFIFYIWHIRHGIGWLILGIISVVVVVILYIWLNSLKKVSIELNEEGKIFLNQKEMDESIKIYTSAIKRNPFAPVNYNNRGIVYYAMKDYDSAIADYDEAVRINPDYDVAYYNRGYAYENKGDINRAIADYESALRLAPNKTKYRDNLQRVRS